MAVQTNSKLLFDGAEWNFDLLNKTYDAIEEIVEPYLLQQGFIGRTPRGRVLTALAYRHLRMEKPKSSQDPQIGLFNKDAADRSDNS